MFKVFVPFHDSSESYIAIKQAVELCVMLKTEYKLTIAFFVALNPDSKAPYIDNLEKSYNLEILEKAVSSVEKCREYLDNHLDKVEYEFIEIEGQGEVGALVEEYLLDKAFDLVICGSRNHGILKRWIYGSVSDYLVHHLRCPVMICKE